MSGNYEELRRLASQIEERLSRLIEESNRLEERIGVLEKDLEKREIKEENDSWHKQQEI